MNRRDTHSTPFNRRGQGMPPGPAGFHAPDDILAEIEAEIDRRYRKQDKHARQDRQSRGFEEPAVRDSALLIARRRR